MILPVALLLIARLTSAHFALEYPEWRADSLENPDFSQCNYPCAGIPSGTGNRTDWPVSGGSVKLDLHHPWTYVFVNVGLGSNVTNFNISLTPSFWNETGNGTLCVPQLPVPVKIGDGQHGTLQVITVGESGSALYNCADVTFRSNASLLSQDDCKNDTGVSFSVISQQSTGGGNGSNNSSNSTSTGKNSASGGMVDTSILLGFLSLALCLTLVF